MTTPSAHPYRDLPIYTRWRKAVAEVSPGDVDPVVDFPFKIEPSHKVATAGSCFAQHIARHLRLNDFNYYVAEPAHPVLDLVPGTADRFNYGTFSARYGNLYTARQLLQLMKRCLGTFTPQERPWEDGDGRFRDPFRPEIQPNGFPSAQELEHDRAQHLRRVREMFTTLDVFVFTMGLTEFWYCKADGAALPICPGVIGGRFDDLRYGFMNQTVADVVHDMTEFLGLLRGLNPRARVILTVSPVPLAATALRKHVLVSTTYSKSVLRVAAEQLCMDYDHVAYFPSYEVITGNFNRGAYYDEGLREVTEAGVNHVMGLFLHHGTVGSMGRAQASTRDSASSAHFDELSKVVATKCEEAAIEYSMSTQCLESAPAPKDDARGMARAISPS